MEITKAQKPVSEAGPNPFAETVKDLVTNGKDGDAVSIKLSTADLGNRTEKGHWAGVEKVRRQLREAGTANGVTVRSKATVTDKPKGSESAVILAWTAPKVARKTKAQKDAEAAAAAAAPDGAATTS